MIGERKIFLFLLLILVLAGVAGGILKTEEQKQLRAQITNFEECAKAYPVAESYPRQCSTPDGRHFVDDNYDNNQLGGKASKLNKDECVRGGCSGQLCIEESEAGDIFTTCEFRPEYACYQQAVCERQSNNECGWTETSELKACFEDVKQFAPEVI